MSEFHNDLQHWLLEPVTDFYTSSHLQLRTNTKDLLTKKNRENKELMKQCLSKIANNIFTAGEAIDILIDKADHKELQNIHDIIQAVKAENNCIEPLTSFKSLISPFYILPPQCIMNMLMFLNKMDVSQLKQTSHDIGLLCIKHMKLLSFGVANINKLLFMPEMYRNTVYFDENLLNISMYQKSQSVLELCYEWQRLYGIPIRYQLFYRDGGIINDLPKDKDIGDMKKNERRLLLLDKRNVIIMSDNESGARIMDEREDINNLTNHHMIILQYFDLFTQTLQFKQVLMVRKNVITQSILDYIQSDYISLNTIQKQANDVLIKNLEDFGTDLAIYKRVIDKDGNVGMNKQLKLSDPVADCGKSEQVVVIIQLAKSMKMNENIKKLETEYGLNEQKFCMDGNTFCDKIRGSFMLNAVYLHDSSLFKAYLRKISADNNKDSDDKKDDKDKEKSNASWDYLLKFIPSGDILLNAFKMNNFTNYGTMGIKISKMLDGFIKPNNIQLFRKNIDESLDILPWNMKTHKYVQDKTIYFDFVDYDIKNDAMDSKEADNDSNVTYFIKIFKPEQCKIPLMGTDYYKKIKSTLILKYPSSFIMNKAFIDCIMKEISKSVYGDCFQDIIKLFKDNEDEKDEGDILYAIHDEKESRTYFMKEEYIADKDKLKVNNLCLFMYKDPNKTKGTKERNIEITFRFWETKDKDFQDRESKQYYSGVPLKIWCKKDDILTDVMKREIYKQSLLIEKVYRYQQNQNKMELVDVDKYKPQNKDLFVLQLVNQKMFS